MQWRYIQEIPEKTEVHDPSDEVYPSGFLAYITLWIEWCGAVKDKQTELGLLDWYKQNGL